MRPRGVFVLCGSGLEAAVRDANESIAELAQRGAVTDTAGRVPAGGVLERRADLAMVSRAAEVGPVRRLQPGHSRRRPEPSALDPGAPGCRHPSFGVPSRTGGNLCDADPPSDARQLV